jgi:hypothetical protein
MAETFWVAIADPVESWATAFALVVGGLWAYYRFGLRREKETALGTELLYSSISQPSGAHLVYFDVTLTNKGAVRLTANREQPAYTDSSECLQYAGDLILRRLPQDTPVGSQVRWFHQPPNQKSPLSGDIEIDLLEAYEEPAEKSDFWMEPGESYHLSAAAVLSAGLYLGIVTFVGAAGPHEYWRRLFLIEVPAPGSRKAIEAAA